MNYIEFSSVYLIAQWYTEIDSVSTNYFKVIMFNYYDCCLYLIS